MNIFTPILFVFYLQVMPPPPSGGSELQSAIITKDINGNDLGIIITDGWRMKKALDTPSYCLGGATGYCDYLSIILGLENGFIKINESQEVWYLWNRSSESQKIGLCQILLNPNKNLTSTVPYKCRNGDYDLPIPLSLRFLLLLSLIWIWFSFYKVRQTLIASNYI